MRANRASELQGLKPTTTLRLVSWPFTLFGNWKLRPTKILGCHTQTLESVMVHEMRKVYLAN
jgi:hypothetical protein